MKSNLQAKLQAIDPRSLGKVAVLMGGHSAEREVSLMSGQGVLEALRSKGVDAHAFDTAKQHIFALKEQGFARCFITLHGRFGEDGTVQGALELMGIPYTGPGVMASAVGVDKTMTKRIWLAEGISTPRHVELAPGQWQEEDVNRVIEQLGLPMIIKPPHEGSSIGVFKAADADAVRKALQDVALMDSAVLCENLIVGDEFTCPVIGVGADAQALPLVRIMAPQGEYDYQNKYFGDAVQYACPSGLPEQVEHAIQQQAVHAYRALGCRGWSRIDVMLRSSDQMPFLLEINTAPGMTSHSLLPMSARAAGIEYADLCLLVLASAALDHALPAQAG
ncbi:MAG: D-alanine--D-alanine ligase [Brachymonas sp.]|nr:D-alanine--D-alanine ligase [Brachymonas sp.]